MNDEIYEVYTPERIAEFLLNNSVMREGYDEACESVRELGLDPVNVPNTDPDTRSTLMSNTEFDELMARLKRRFADNPNQNR